MREVWRGNVERVLARPSRETRNTQEQPRLFVGRCPLNPGTGVRLLREGTEAHLLLGGGSTECRLRGRLLSSGEDDSVFGTLAMPDGGRGALSVRLRGSALSLSLEASDCDPADLSEPDWEARAGAARDDRILGDLPVGTRRIEVTVVGRALEAPRRLDARSIQATEPSAEPPPAAVSTSRGTHRSEEPLVDGPTSDEWSLPQQSLQSSLLALARAADAVAPHWPFEAPRGLVDGVRARLLEGRAPEALRELARVAWLARSVEAQAPTREGRVAGRGLHDAAQALAEDVLPWMTGLFFSQCGLSKDLHAGLVTVSRGFASMMREARIDQLELRWEPTDGGDRGDRALPS